MVRPYDAEDAAKLLDERREREGMNNHHPETTSAGGKKPRPNGGSAFPTDGFKYSLEHGDHQTGMSLRDYFAAGVLPQLLDVLPEKAFQNPSHLPAVYEEVAQHAYSLADAMLLARDK